jgi:hypothetical protein
MPITIGLIVAGGAIVGKTIDSAVQARRARNAAEEIRNNLVEPTYNRDETPFQMYADIKNEGIITEMPQMAAMRNRQMTNASSYLGDIANMAGGSSAAKMGALQGLYEKSIMPGEADIAMASANYADNQRQMKTRNMMALLPMMNAEKRMEYVENVRNPYARGLAESAALEQASLQHRENAWNTVMQGGMMFAGGLGQGGTGGTQASSMVPGTGASGAAASMNSFTSMPGSYGANYGAQANSFGNYGTPAAGSGMGGMWQGQLGNSFGGGYYDPNMGTWVSN